VKGYHINIFYSEVDKGYIADIPDLEACSAFGKTPADVLKQVQLATSAWLEAARAAGKPIPKPRYRPAIYQRGPMSIVTALVLSMLLLVLTGCATSGPPSGAKQHDEEKAMNEQSQRAIMDR
jgi:predicted RNase H-like HicB family nuclease